MKIKINSLNKIKFIILFLILSIIFISLFIIENLFIVIFSYVLILFLIMIFKIYDKEKDKEINEGKNKEIDKGNIFGFPEIEFNEYFDLNGEPATIELHEYINPETRVSHYVAVLVMIGRDRLKFSQKEVDEKELKIISFEDWNWLR